MRTKINLFFSAILVLGFCCFSYASNNSPPIDGVAYYNPPVIWADETNFLRGSMDEGRPLATSIRVGIQVVGGEIVLSGQPLKLEHPASIGFESLNTNDYPKLDGSTNTWTVPANSVTWMYLPPIKERLQLNLTDSSGANVPKTREGRSLGHPFSLKPKTTWMQLPREGSGRRGMMALMPTPGFTSCMEFDPSQYFVLTNIGLYKLTATLSIYVEDTNICLKPVTLPPVTVDVRVEK